MLQEESFDHNIDSDDSIDKNLVIGYKCSSKHSHSNEELKETHKTRLIIDQIEEAGHLDL